VKLGNPDNFNNESRKLGSKKMIEKAKMNSNNIKAKKVIHLLHKNGMTLREITNELNNSGFQTSKGLAFHPEQVRRLL